MKRQSYTYIKSMFFHTSNLRSATKHYDSQSGTTIRIVDANKIRLHDFSFIGNVKENFEVIRIEKFLNYIESSQAKTTTIGMSQDSYVDLVSTLHIDKDLIKSVLESREKNRALNKNLEPRCSMLLAISPSENTLETDSESSMKINIEPQGVIFNANLESTDIDNINPIDLQASKVSDIKSVLAMIEETKQQTEKNDIVTQVKLHITLSSMKSTQAIIKVGANIASLADLGVQHIFIVPTIENNMIDNSDVMQHLIEECYGLDIEGDSMRDRLGFQGGLELSQLAIEQGITRLGVVSKDVIKETQLIDDNYRTIEHYLFLEDIQETICEKYKKQIVTDN